jgi:hypothetical protein
MTRVTLGKPIQHPAALESMVPPGAGCHARGGYFEVDAIVPYLYLTGRLMVWMPCG